MEPAQMDRTPFADIDNAPAGLHAILFAALEAMGRHPEIQRVRQVAYAALRPAPGQSLLDAGAGTGDVARALATTVTDTGLVVALDSSEAILAAARARHDGGPVRYVTGDVSALDLPDGAMDGVWCERVLQHVPDADRAIAEFARVTRPGGRVCLIDTDWYSLTFDGVSEALAAAVLDQMRLRLAGHHRDMGRTLRRRMVSAGLRDVQPTPVTCCFVDPASAAVVLPMVNPAVPRDAFMTAEDIRELWLADVAAAGERQEFLAALTIWVVVGTVAG
jgi:SAM-dependent methyltransferase